MVKAQQSHLFVCGKHNSQMYVFVCTDMGVSQSIFTVIQSEVIRFPRLQSLPLFFLKLVPIHSVSHTYIDALCSILSNFCLHFTRLGPYSNL